MPIISQPIELPPEFIGPLSIVRYHQMIEAGILMPDDPVELLEGCLVRKAPQSPQRCYVRRELREWFDGLIPTGYYSMAQDPVTLDTSEPEPDNAVIRGDIRQFAKQHPLAKDAVLFVDVSDTTLTPYRDRKKRIYAKAKIPRYWIINLEDRQIEVYRDPDPAAGDYRQHTVYGVAHEFLVFIDGKSVGALRLAQLLPPE